MPHKHELIAELKRRLRTQRTPQLPTLVMPVATEQRYAVEVAAAVTNQGIRDIQIIVRRYTEELAKVQDAPANLGRELKTLLGSITREEALGILPAAREAAQAIDTANNIQVAQQVEAALGSNALVALPNPEAKLQRELERFLNESVKFVEKTRKKSVKEFSDLAIEHFNKGSDVGTLEQALVDRLHVSQSRAKLIARDQSGKYFGALTRARHESIGVEKYRWTTTGDSRVRGEHQARDGQIFTYKNPPSDGNPGEPIRCRCVATPIFDD